ncbi:MAG: U32 family peptidase [Gemmiger sp.]
MPNQQLNAPRAVPEILAPAGNEEMLGAAVLSGADAVYLGLTGFNARRSAGNFTPDALKKAVCFCHARNVRVHVTLNTLLFGSELNDMAAAVRAVAEAGADAVIADDLATAALVRRIAPDLALHASTQMSVHTAAGARQLAAMGFSRVILARELTLEEIAAITAACPVETEVFVHGAMCMSMSGQCMMSAFLGGRSGNRGACAGPCRLPFDANTLPAGKPGTACHLSLKDMDLIGHLPELAAAGVASVKIEGRLRTPEYAASAVAACRAAREGQPYNEALLRDIFSRSGFSDAYLTGRTGREMFGVRTEADAAATRAAAPRARELYRREMSRVPVRFTLTLTGEGAKLCVEDADGNRAAAYYTEELSPARSDPDAALHRSLEKTGGTPFLAADCRIESEGGPWFLPASGVNDLRRRCLTSLLEKRSAPHPLRICPPPASLTADFPLRAPLPAQKPLAVRCERYEQFPAGRAGSVRYLILPVAEAEKVPAPLRVRTLLELPRAMFGALEQRTAGAMASCAGQGFAGFVANNPAHLKLAEGLSLPLYGGLGLNVTNPLAAREYALLGLAGMLIHPETPVAAMRAVAPGVPTAALCYGHIPLMLTRACPLHNVHGCAGCSRQGALRDRKGRDFPVRCARGMRTVFNPVPLYMGDRLAELPVDLTVAAFTLESAAETDRVVGLLLEQLPFDGEFTRGLYYKTV